MTNQELMHRLRTCGHYLHRMSDGRASQRRILGILSERQELSQRELQDILDIRSASVSEVLAKLEGEGLIERAPSDDDRRNMLVRLSAKGREAAVELGQADSMQMEEMFSCLDEVEKESLGELLGRLQAHWNEHFNSPYDREGGRHGHRQGGRGGHHPHAGGPFGHHEGHGPREGHAPHEGHRPREGRTPYGDSRGRDGLRTLSAERHEAGERREKCIDNCHICPLRAEGRCVRRRGTDR